MSENEKRARASISDSTNRDKRIKKGDTANTREEMIAATLEYSFFMRTYRLDMTMRDERIEMIRPQ